MHPEIESLKARCDRRQRRLDKATRRVAALTDTVCRLTQLFEEINVQCIVLASDKQRLERANAVLHKQGALLLRHAKGRRDARAYAQLKRLLWDMEREVY